MRLWQSDRRRVFLCVIGLAAGIGAASPAQGQSLLARGGLGLRADPLDARARGLGGVGLGLPGVNLSLVNPAGIAGLPAPALHVTFQPDFYTTEFSGGATSGSTARFPLLHVALPFGERLAFSVGYGSVLDQNWAVEDQDSLVIGTDTLAVRDRFASRGGVARLRLGGSYLVSESLALGLALDVHTGSVRDTIVRSFENRDLRSAGATSVRDYSGLGYAAGLRWTPSGAVVVGGSVSFGGVLEAESQDTARATVEYDLPVVASLGASARVTANTLVAVATHWGGWSSVSDDGTEAETARDTWSVAGGIEWDAISLGEQTIPLRVGGRWEGQPFEWDSGGDAAGFVNERAVTGGLGLRLAEGAARADIAVERGQRSGDDTSFSESFWRVAVSLTVLGR